MPRYRLTVEYDGGPFAGWQRQEGAPTVQGALEAALARIEPAPGPVTGAGRTDAGVHALAQVAHCDLSRAWEPFRLAAALNHHLRPDPVAVIAVAPAAADFHARFDAVERRYLYRIAERAAPLALERGRAWRRVGPLDDAAMAEAAARLVGRHDFTTFRSVQCQALSPLKTLDRLAVRREGARVEIEAVARSFLHNQVRSMVGALVEVGRGRWTPDDVAVALAARDRAACAPVAPAEGLFLAAVRYPGEPQTA